MNSSKKFALLDKHILWLKIAIHGLCLFFLLQIYYLGFTDRLGGDPVEAIIHFTGLSALKLLLLTLLVSPLSRWTRQGKLIRLRRLLGLYCFTYALAHVTNYISFDLQFDWSLVLEELTERPYIVVGMMTFLILLSLAITSIPALVRKLGRRWKVLHRWIYVAAVLACVHFWWSVKADITEPVAYLGMALVLLSVRGKELLKLFKPGLRRRPATPAKVRVP